MRPLLTPEQMAAADRAAITGGTPAEVLMDRAGRALARAAIREVGGRYGKTAVVICGKGNNGGDGLVAARILRREGLGVKCLFSHPLDNVEGAVGHHLDLLHREGLRVEPFTPQPLKRADVVIDAIFGTGFRGHVEGELGEAIESINACGAPVVSADIPSGVNGETGKVEGPAVRADVTVAMGSEKIGTAIGEGPSHAGRVETIDIGIEIPPVETHLLEESDARRVLPRRDPDAHKRSGGSVALLVGSGDMPGAAVLSAAGAARMGAGYVSVGTAPTVVGIVDEALPEVLASCVSSEDEIGRDGLGWRPFADALERADALAIGPGLGTGDRQEGLVEAAIEWVEIPIVIDADGLNVLAKRTHSLEIRPFPTVITPHPGELARLLEVSTSEIQSDRLTSTRKAAERFKCVVLLKGHRTIVADQSGRAVVNPSGGPELASAGTGDVLTGAVAALLAAGLDPFEAAWAAAYVHGYAGGLAAQRRGTNGVAAGDVAAALGPAAASIQQSSA
jgi:ADP-dependent NAD(P)H-hydrate dehydratase / NAD(P)H-hydrate epimerase